MISLALIVGLACGQIQQDRPVINNYNVQVNNSPQLWQCQDAAGGTHYGYDKARLELEVAWINYRQQELMLTFLRDFIDRDYREPRRHRRVWGR